MKFALQNLRNTSQVRGVNSYPANFAWISHFQLPFELLEEGARGPGAIFHTLKTNETHVKRHVLRIKVHANQITVPTGVLFIKITSILPVFNLVFTM